MSLVCTYPGEQQGTCSTIYTSLPDSIFPTLLLIFLHIMDSEYVEDDMSIRSGSPAPSLYSFNSSVDGRLLVRPPESLSQQFNAYCLTIFLVA